MPKLLFISGSMRDDSMNKKLAIHAAKVAGEKGVEATFVDLKDYEMPLYDGDLEKEQGMPENAIKLKELFIEHDGFFMATPEYNGFMSALLKNTIDWLSRPHLENEASLSAFSGKKAAIASVSPGPLGGIRGLPFLRLLLSNIGVLVASSQLAVGSGFNAFDDTGSLSEETQRQRLENVIDELVAISS